MIVRAATATQTQYARQRCGSEIGIDRVAVASVIGIQPTPGPDARVRGSRPFPTREHGKPRRPASEWVPASESVDPGGFEPPTFSLRTRRATNCAMGPSENEPIIPRGVVRPSARRRGSADRRRRRSTASRSSNAGSRRRRFPCARTGSRAPRPGDRMPRRRRVRRGAERPAREHLGTSGASCSARRATAAAASTRLSSAAASIDAIAVAAIVPRERCRGRGSGCGVQPSSAAGSASSIGSNGVDSGTATGAAATAGTRTRARRTMPANATATPRAPPPR